MRKLEQLNNVKERILSELADAEYNLNEYQEEVERLEQQLADINEEIDEILEDLVR